MLQTPTVYNGAPHIHHQNYPLPQTNPQTQLPTSSLDPSDLLSQTASISDHRFVTIHRTYRHTHKHTEQDSWRECSMTIGHICSIEYCGLIIHAFLAASYIQVITKSCLSPVQWPLHQLNPGLASYRCFLCFHLSQQRTPGYRFYLPYVIPVTQPTMAMC